MHYCDTIFDRLAELLPTEDRCGPRPPGGDGGVTRGRPVAAATAHSDMAAAAEAAAAAKATANASVARERGEAPLAESSCDGPLPTLPPAFIAAVLWMHNAEP